MGEVIDMREDARDRLGYVVAYERDVDGLTVRDPRDVASVRFDTLAAFPTYEEASAFIWVIEHVCGGVAGWRRVSDPIARRGTTPWDIPGDGDGSYWVDC